MRERLSDYQEQYGDLYNLEATPAESTAYRLAKHDKARYPDIITASENSDVPYYTNSSHLPVGYTDDIFSALAIQDQLQTLYTSGTVFHAFTRRKAPRLEGCRNAGSHVLPRITVCPITPFRRPIRSAVHTDIFRASIIPVRNAASPRRFTAVLPATTARYKTGTPERPRNLKSASSTT